MAVLADAGYAWRENFNAEEIRVSLGMALRLDMVFGYFIGGAFDVGYSRGLNEDGIGEYWILLTGIL